MPAAKGDAKIMRIDKFLKVSRIIKRRSVANQACSSGAVKINGKEAKPGSKTSPGDIIEIKLGEKERKYEVLEVAGTAGKQQAAGMYRELL